MSRLRLLALALFLGGIFLIVTAPTEADNQRYLTGDPRCFDCPGWYTAPEVARLTATGEWRWDTRVDGGGINILPAVLTGLDEYSEAFSILMAYTPGAPAHIASGGMAFIYGTADRPGCGSGATACLPRYGISLDIVYDSVSMSTWSLRSQTGVVLHELGHAVMDAGEMYRHTGGQIACTGKPWTVMDCGLGHAQTIQPFDRQTFALKHYPAALTEYGMGQHPDGTPYVYWGAGDKRSTRVALLDEAGWTGVYLEPVFQSGAYRGQVVAGGHCYWLKAESELSWRYAFTEVFVGCAVEP